MGVWSLRIAVLDAEDGEVAAGTVRKLTVYGRIPLRQLLDDSVDDTVTIGQHSFRYVWSPNIDSFTYDEDGMDLGEVVSTRCRSIHFDIGSSTRTALTTGDDVDNFTVVQEAADPVSVTVNPGTVRTLDATLRPGHSWALRMSGAYYAYLNGYAWCYGQDEIDTTI